MQRHHVGFASYNVDCAVGTRACHHRSARPQPHGKVLALSNRNAKSHQKHEPRTLTPCTGGKTNQKSCTTKRLFPIGAKTTTTTTTTTTHATQKWWYRTCWSAIAVRSTTTQTRMHADHCVTPHFCTMQVWTPSAVRRYMWCCLRWADSQVH